MVISRLSTFSFSSGRVTMLGEVHGVQTSKTWQPSADPLVSYAKWLSCRPRRQIRPGWWACSLSGRT